MAQQPLQSPYRGLLGWIDARLPIPRLLDKEYSQIPIAAEPELLLELRRHSDDVAHASDRNRHCARDALQAVGGRGVRFGRAYHARRQLRLADALYAAADASASSTTRMIRHVLPARQQQEFAQAQAVGTAPLDPALAVQPLEIADQKHAEIPARWKRRAPSCRRRIEGLAQFLDEPIEAGGSQDSLQLVIEWMAR